MYGRIIALSCVLISIVSIRASVPPPQSYSIVYEKIDAEDFFGELVSKLNINLDGLEAEYEYCSPQIAYLVHMGYITPQQADSVTSGKYSTSFLIDKGFLLVRYFERPMDKGAYGSIIERVSKETNLVEESFDISKELSYMDAIQIINNLVNDNFERVKYSDINTKIDYTIDNFYNMSATLKKTLNYIDMLPKSCIAEFNRRKFTLKIVENAVDVHPYKRTHVTAFTNFRTKEICIMKDFERDIFHEFGHLMFDKINNKQQICEYLYKNEGQTNVFFRATNAEEYCADFFGNIILYQNNIEYIQQLKRQCPLTFNFMQQIICYQKEE